MSEKVKVGIIGGGRMGQRHLKALKTLDNVEIVGLADPVEETRKKIESEFSVKTYASPAELYSDAKPAVAYVTTPISMHLEHIREAFEAGCHVFSEKPLVATNEQGEKLMSLCKDYNDRILFTGLVWRYESTAMAIREAIQSGAIGEVLQFRATCGGPSVGKRPAWFDDRKAAIRGCMLDNGVHIFDMTAWTLGDFESAAAFTDQTDERTDWNSAIIVKTAKGAYGTYHYTSIMPLGADLYYYGKEGTIYYSLGKPEYQITKKGGQPETVKVDPVNRFEDMAKDFISCVVENKPSPVSIEDGLRATAIADAGYESSESGKVEKVRKF